MPPWCELILGLKVEAVQGKQVSLEWTDIWGTLGMVARPWSSSRLSYGESLLLTCDGNAGNSFPTKQERIPPLEYEAETVLLWMWAELYASSRVETGMSGNFLSCSNGVNDHLEVPDIRSD